jgi:hypothetical protein
MKKTLLIPGCVLAICLVAAAAYAADDPDAHPVRGWQNTTPSGVSQAAKVDRTSGGLNIDITIQGQSAGSPGPVGSPAGLITEAPRGGISGGGPGISRPPTHWLLSPPTGGANTFGTGPISTETGPNGLRVDLGGRSIGGWSFISPPGPAITTAFAPVGPVPHIDPWTVATQAQKEFPLPTVTLKANPDPGVVALPSWFWITGYDGSVLTHTKTQHASHTECRLLNGATDCRLVDDSVTVTVRLTPTHYQWTFGDGQTGSQQIYPNPAGLGRAYTDPHTPSPVAWSYQFSSFGHLAGFPIAVTITFASEFQANGGPWAGLDPVTQTYTGSHVVEQVQPLRVASSQQEP